MQVFLRGAYLHCPGSEFVVKPLDSSLAEWGRTRRDGAGMHPVDAWGDLAICVDGGDTDELSWEELQAGLDLQGHFLATAHRHTGVVMISGSVDFFDHSDIIINFS